MKQLLILMLAAMLTTACQKENTSPKTPGSVNGSNGPAQQQGTSLPSSATPTHLDGTYTGNFSLSTPTYQGPTVNVGLVITGDQYTSGPNSERLQNFYFIGEGTVATNSNTMIFTSAPIAYPAYMTQGQAYAWGTPALAGTYNYSVKGDSLLIYGTSNNTTYSYKLKKQ